MFKIVGIRSVFGMLVFAMATACNTPEQQLADLQRKFTEKCPKPRQRMFEVKAGKQTLVLPLPDTPEHRQSVFEFVADIRRQADTIPAEDLQAPLQQRLVQFRHALDVVLAQRRPGDGYFSPEEYALAESAQWTDAQAWQQKPALLLALLEQTPAYYAEVERCWAPPGHRQAEAALEQAMHTLEQINTLTGRTELAPAAYRARVEAALPAARMAVKDFIAMCCSPR